MGRLYTCLDMEYVQYKMAYFSHRVKDLTPSYTVFHKEHQVLKKRFEELYNVVKVYDRLAELGTPPKHTEVHKLVHEKNEVLQTLDVLSQRLDIHYIDSFERNDKSFGTGESIPPGTPIAKRLEDFSDGGSSVGHPGH